MQAVAGRELFRQHAGALRHRGEEGRHEFRVAGIDRFREAIGRLQFLRDTPLNGSGRAGEVAGLACFLQRALGFSEHLVVTRLRELLGLRQRHLSRIGTHQFQHTRHYVGLADRCRELAQRDHQIATNRERFVDLCGNGRRGLAQFGQLLISHRLRELPRVDVDVLNAPALARHVVDEFLQRLRIARQHLRRAGQFRQLLHLVGVILGQHRVVVVARETRLGRLPRSAQVRRHFDRTGGDLRDAFEEHFTPADVRLGEKLCDQFAAGAASGLQARLTGYHRGHRRTGCATRVAQDVAGEARRQRVKRRDRHAPLQCLLARLVHQRRVGQRAVNLLCVGRREAGLADRVDQAR